MNSLFDLEWFDQSQSRPEVDEAQLRSDFDYPADACFLQLMQLEQDGPTGKYYQLTMLWRERRIKWRFSSARQEWEQTEEWEAFERQLTPRYAAYL